MVNSRILVVDEPENAAWIRGVLEPEGHLVHAAASTAEARHLIARSEFDVVLCDLRYPDSDALGLVAEVRKLSADTVCIILAASASLDSAVRALRHGAYDYLIKPCGADELRSTVNRALERRRLGRALHEHVRELEDANRTITALNADLVGRVEAATAELRSQYERLKELDRLKTQFISVASHELKTPVTAMSGFLQIALRRLSKRLAAGYPEPAAWEGEAHATIEQLEVARRQTAKLARLIDELLDVSLIQSGRVEFRFDQVDLGQLAREVVERMQTTTTEHTLRVDADSTTLVTADRDHLERVLTNLVANAIKYSPDGGTIEVALAMDGDGALVSVHDRGIGIPAEELEAVFQLFYRSPDRAARDVGGMGIGLYISRQIVDRHGGHIWAESDGDGGSTFHVRLPLMGDPPERGRDAEEPVLA